MIYLISPYEHDTDGIMQLRYEMACEACVILTGRGFVMYSPIVHWHPIACRFDLPRDHEFWMFHNHEMISLSGSVLVLKLIGWADSKGVHRDTQEALSQNKPLHHSERHELSSIEL